MGQKVNPIGFRVGVNRKWRSNWFSQKQGPGFVKQDHEIRKLVHARYSGAGLADVFIERPSASDVGLTIRTARPGIIIGKQGSEIDSFQKTLERRFGRKFKISIQEVENPDTEAILIAEDLAYRIANRTPPMRAIKEVISRTMDKGVQGVKVACAGRLGGAEIARSVWQKAGRVPLHTIRADIDYGFTEAWTKTGHIGIKVWLFRGEHLKLAAVEPKPRNAQTPAAPAPTPTTDTGESAQAATSVEGGADAAVDA